MNNWKKIASNHDDDDDDDDRYSDCLKKKATKQNKKLWNVSFPPLNNNKKKDTKIDNKRITWKTKNDKILSFSHHWYTE